ncbi:MAG: hypothetical protein JRN03_01605 [Nitrososphaerota archaeon]|nr:hypothetical protein [Nitrososphaerota archaeon]
MKEAEKLRATDDLAVDGDSLALLERLRSIQDEPGAIRDRDRLTDYLSGRARLTGTRALIREEIARRHGMLEDFHQEPWARGGLSRSGTGRRGGPSRPVFLTPGAPADRVSPVV